MKKQPESTAKNHSIGDKLTIRNKFYGHEFKIGEKVEIVDICGDDYKDKRNNQWWWVADQNFMTKKQLSQLKSIAPIK